MGPEDARRLVFGGVARPGAGRADAHGDDEQDGAEEKLGRHGGHQFNLWSFTDLFIK